MQSCAFMNGQHQQAGPLPQLSQGAPNLTHNGMRSQLSGTANNAYLGVQPPQSANFASQNGSYSNGQMSYWQPSTGPHQAISPEQKSKKKPNSPLIEMLLTSPPSSIQSEIKCWPTSHERQAATQHNFQQNSATQSQPNKMTANTTYNHSNKSSHLKQKASVNEGHLSRIQHGHTVSRLQHSNVPNGYYQNASGGLTNPGSAYSTTPTSVAHEHISVSATAHNRQTTQAAYNQIHGQNNPQLGFSHSTPQAGHSMFPCQPHGNNSIPAHSSSRTQMLYPTQGSSACNNGGNSTVSSNANSSNQYETRYYLSKTNELPLNPALHQQILRQCMSADGSHLSYTTVHNQSPSHKRKSYNWHNFTHDAKKAKMQPVLSAVSEGCNLNNTQSSSLHSGQSLPESSQSLMSGSGQLVNKPHQQNSVPNVFATTAGHGSIYGKADIANPHNNNTASKGNPVGSLSVASQPTQLPKDTLPQGNKTQSSVVNNLTLLEMMLQNGSSSHSSSGLCSTRAVAVVPPLSSESCQNAITLFNAATNESSRNSDRVCVSPDVSKNRNCENLTKESNLYPDNTNQLQSNKSDTRCAAASNDGALLSKSDSGPQNLAQGSALDLSVEKTAENSVLQKVPVSQNCPEDQAEKVNIPTPIVLELSSLPTIQWTAHSLAALIEKTEKVQKKTGDFTEENFIRKILHLFWGGSCKAVISELHKGWHKILIGDILKFFSTHMYSDTVVLTQVNRKLKKLCNYHSLHHDEVYSELPYKSSWLNLNEQLDDIDKEFGFPVTLVSPPQLESDNQTDQAEPIDSILEKVVSEEPEKVLLPTEPVNSIPEPAGSEKTDKVLLPTEPELVDSGKEKPASTVKAPSTQTPSSNEEESCDSWYSFDIQVMPPEEAKHLFEQVQTEKSQSKDTDCQAEKVISSCVETETSKDTDSTLSILMKDACEPIEQVCCLARLAEIVTGEGTYFSKCQCSKHSNNDKCIDETPNKDKEEVPRDNSLFENSSYRIFDLIMEEGNPTEDTENANDQVTICSSELCDDVIEIIELTDDDGEHNSICDPGNISEISNSSQSSFPSIIDNEYEDLPNSENEIPVQMPKLTIEPSEPEDECEQEQLKSTETMQSSASMCDNRQTKSIKSGDGKRISDHEQGGAQPQLKSADVAESFLEIKGQTQISATTDLQTSASHSSQHEIAQRKRKRLSSHDTFSPFQEKSKKCKLSVDLDSEHSFDGVSKCQKNLVDATEAHPLTANARTAELVLFGSSRQDKSAMIGAGKSHVLLSKGVSCEGQRPPELLSVNLSPLKMKSSIALHAREQSIKELLYEKWRKSMPPTKIRHKNKFKRQKYSSASVPSIILRRKNSGMRVWKAKKPKVHDGHGGSNTKNESNKIGPLYENSILKFCVLPNTFDFKHGFEKKKESMDPASDKPDHAKEENQHSKRVILKIKGTWYPNPEKKYKPMRPSHVPKTSSLFQEFQKKYVQKTSSMDE